MRTREQIEKDASEARQTLGAALLIEVLLDIRDLQQQIEARLADAQTNRKPFHIDEA